MIAFLFILLFQVTATVNQQHPPVQVIVTPAEKKQLAKVPFNKFDEIEQAKRAIIDKHYPAHEPKASWKPCTEGYRGHMYRPDDIIYTWDTPKCVGTK